MKFDWRRNLPLAAIMGMEACASYALLFLLNKRVVDGSLSIFWLLLLYPIAFGFNKFLLRWQLDRVYATTANILAWGIGTLLLIKSQLFDYLAITDPTWLMAIPQAITNILHAFEPVLLILLSSAALWWLGRRLAQGQASFTTVISEFQFGLAIMLIIFFTASQLDVQFDNPIALVTIFFLFGLLGMSIAHAQEGTGWLAGLSRARWTGLLLISISFILIVGLFIGSIITPNLLQVVLDALKWAGSQILKGIIFLINLLPAPEPESIPALPTTPIPNEDAEVARLMSALFSESVRTGLRIAWTVLVIGVILFALWRVSSQIFGWIRRKLATTPGAEIEPIQGAFMADLLGLLKRILFKLMRFKLPARRPKKAEPQEIVSVRQIYRRLLQWVASRGWPRQVSLTPYEYLPVLEGLLPTSKEMLRFITQHYVNARYGLSSPSQAELHQLKEGWHQIRQNHIPPPDDMDDKLNKSGGNIHG